MELRTGEKIIQLWICNEKRIKGKRNKKQNTAKWKNNLRSIVGNYAYKNWPENVGDLVNNRNLLATFLSTAAESQPQGTYLASVSGFQSK